MKEKIKALVMNSFNELKDTNDFDYEIDDETILLGENSVMDSFDFVSLIATVEEKIADEFDKSIAIVSERAFSMKHSPFKTIDRIVDYIIDLLDEVE